jgi:hypothetical protein
MTDKLIKSIFVMLIVISIGFISLGLSLSLTNIKNCESKSMLAMYETAINTTHN